MYVKQVQPVLERLQGKATEDESNAANRGEQPLPWQRKMIQPTSYSIQFDSSCNTYRKTRSKAEEGTQADTVTDTEHYRVRYDPRKQPQRAMLSTQKVVSKIKASHYIQAAARNADRRNCMVVHFKDCYGIT